MTSEPSEPSEPTMTSETSEPSEPSEPTMTSEPSEDPVERVELRPGLEALLLVADQPMEHSVLAAAVGWPVVDVVDALHSLAEEYDAQRRGFELRHVAGGWRYYTREEFAAVVETHVLEGQQARLTQAALETLAVVAYRQPVTRARVSAIRGVNVDGVMRTLLTRGLVEEAGADGEHGAHLYRTTSHFLERMGLVSLDELPEIAAYLPDIDDVDDPDGLVDALGDVAPLGEDA